MPGLSPRRTDPPSPSPTRTTATATAAATATATAPAATPSRPAAVPPPATSPPAPAPPPPPIEARYRVADTFPGGFIGELSIRNASRGDLGWVARVEYPGGRVVTAWLEGVPQGTFQDRRGTLVYRSGPDLAAGSAVALRFHVEFASSRPASCVVSGRPCGGL
ncbi:cellulose-binding protein [Micromonospora radicis]|uniref:Cellulose-binding protein n=1 Tax=Micromonospora radicis TaxID=1894971 RepID=A0A418MYE7_9ACTN|nr:cellulose-binding protein [Micromonospora radicis]